METKKGKTIKVATNEKVANTTKNDLFEELAVKKQTLANHEARLNGGVVQLGQDKRKLIPIDEELRNMRDIARMKEIMISHDAPLNAKFMYEKNEEYREIKRRLDQIQLDEYMEHVPKVEKQKEDIVKQIPELKARIEELEKQIQ